MKLLQVTIFIAVTLNEAIGQKVRYDNYTLYRLIPKTAAMVDILRDLENGSLTALNFFSPVGKENFPVDILVAPTHVQEFKTLLKSGEIESELLIKDFQKSIDAENFSPVLRTTTFDWTRYPTLDEINAWLTDLALKYPDKVSIVTAGRTYENRSIDGVRISFSPGNAKHSVFIEANIHAREWISSSVATFIINELVVSQDPNIQEIARGYDWYIFPVTNPDGFAYSTEHNRLWRKTRKRYDDCYGADPNRNWPFQWMKESSSATPCSDIYAGPFPFSENCTNDLAQFIRSIGTDLEAYISFHAYSQLLLIPYGHTTTHMDNYDDLILIGHKAMYDLSRRYGTKYVVGNTAETIYKSTGGSIDWVKHTFGTPITYTYELRDRGRNGFILPVNQIIPTALETLDSLVSIFQSYRRLHPGSN